MPRFTRHASRFITLVAVLLLPTSYFLLPSLAQAAGVDEACSADTDCVTSSCSGTGVGCFCAGLIAGPSGHCQLKSAAGEPCTESGHCQATLTCNIAVTPAVCVATAVPVSPTAPGPTGASAPTDASVAPVFHTPTEYGYVNPLGTTNISTIINNIIKTALGFVGALFLAMFVYGGARWMTAGGEEKNVQSAKNTIRNAVIGMLVIALSYGIISLIFQTASQIQAPVAPTPGQGCIRSSDCSDITATCESGICVSSLRAP